MLASVHQQTQLVLDSVWDVEPMRPMKCELGDYIRKPGRPRNNCVDNGHHQTRSEGHGHYLGRNRSTGDRQSRMASTCGPMHPSGIRMQVEVRSKV